MMKNYTLGDLNENYNLELERVLEEIARTKAKIVLLQFPDGLKQYATAIVDFLEEKLAPKGVHPKSESGCKFLIWFGSCYGACDTPVLNDKLKKEINLVIQFGHNSLLPNY